MEIDTKCVSILDGCDADNLIELFLPDVNGNYKVPAMCTTEQEYRNLLSLIELCKLPDNLKDGSAYKIAILDTGILEDHPIFRRYIKNFIDFTGEGISDKNGHGSMVTIQLLISGDQPMSYNNTELYICKIVSADGRGTEDQIIKGMKWAEEQNVNMINLSAGISNRIWYGLRECNGTCEVCQTAYNLNPNIIILAAAGNNGKTVCPAKVSLYFENSGVISVGALDQDNMQKASWSGKASHYTTGYISMDGTILLNNL